MIITVYHSLGTELYGITSPYKTTTTVSYPVLTGTQANMLRYYLYDEFCNVLDDYLVEHSIARMKDLVTSFDVAEDLFEWGPWMKSREGDGILRYYPVLGIYLSKSRTPDLGSWY